MRSAVLGSVVLSILVGGVLLLALGGVATIVLTKSWSASSWPETTCTILDARAVEDAQSDYTAWYVKVSWKYEVDGVRYEVRDEQPEVFGIVRDQVEAERIAARYAKEGTVACYLNPDDPRECKLDRSPPPFAPFVAFLAVAISLLGSLLGSVGTFVWLRSRARR